MTDGTNSSPAPKLVLMIDDDASFLDLVEVIIKREGYRTDRSASGPEALSKIEKTSPDLVLLDLMLPGIGGYELARELQARGHGDIPIIVVTGRQMDRQGVEMIRQEPNVRYFLEKPIRGAALATELHRLLDGPLETTAETPRT